MDQKRSLYNSHDGQKVYTRTLLRVYDLWVLGISNSFIWKCPTQKMVAFYSKHVSVNHLDVGVGTGYYLAHCKFPVKKPNIVLADLNRNSLEWSAKRIARYAPKMVRMDVFEPIDLPGSPFRSIGIQYLLHCLPGNMESKEIVFRNLKSHLDPEGVIFGATLLGKGIEKSSSAEKLMAFYNSKGVFSNLQDDLDSLCQSLQNNFSKVSIEVHGCVAMFSAKHST